MRLNGQENTLLIKITAQYEIENRNLLNDRDMFELEKKKLQ